VTSWAAWARYFDPGRAASLNSRRPRKCRGAAIQSYARPLDHLIACDANEGDTRLSVTDFLCERASVTTSPAQPWTTR
jgi:hypothetical protein